MQRILKVLTLHVEDEMALSEALVKEAGGDPKWPERFERFSRGQWTKEEIIRIMKLAKGEWAPWMLHAPAKLQSTLGYCSVAEQDKFRYKARLLAKAEGGKVDAATLKVHDMKAHELDQLIDFTTKPAHVRNDAEQKTWLATPLSFDEQQECTRHRSFDRLIRGSCTEDQAKDISYLLGRNDQWAETIWQAIRSQRLLAEQGQKAA